MACWLCTCDLTWLRPSKSRTGGPCAARLQLPFLIPLSQGPIFAPPTSQPNVHDNTTSPSEVIGEVILESESKHPYRKPDFLTRTEPSLLGHLQLWGEGT